MVTNPTDLPSKREKLAASLAMVLVFPTPVGPTKATTVGRACSFTGANEGQKNLDGAGSSLVTGARETCLDIPSTARRSSPSSFRSTSSSGRISSLSSREGERLVLTAASFMFNSFLFKCSSTAAKTSKRFLLKKPKKPPSLYVRELRIKASGPNSRFTFVTASCAVLATYLLTLIHPHLPFLKNVPLFREGFLDMK